MNHVPALKSAFALIQLPSQIRTAREAPLPNDLLLLLRIAAGDDDATLAAERLSGQPRPAVREAAGFFIEQVLLFPEADSYRVLGVAPNASTEELRRNMALLLRWLHPDMHNARSIFASRVTRAWNDLKTPERRAAYDLGVQRTRMQRSLDAKKMNSNPRSRSGRGRHDGIRHGMGQPRRQEAGLLDRLLFVLLGRFVQ